MAIPIICLLPSSIDLTDKSALSALLFKLLLTLNNTFNILKYTNLVTLLAALVYVVCLFALGIHFSPSQLGFVLLVAFIAYKNFKKPDLVWTIISTISMVGMWFSLF